MSNIRENYGIKTWYKSKCIKAAAAAETAHCLTINVLVQKQKNTPSPITLETSMVQLIE